MALKLTQGMTAAQAAQALLGDSRLVNEIQIIDGHAYVKGESPGPPAKWAGAPPDLPKTEPE